MLCEMLYFPDYVKAYGKSSNKSKADLNGCVDVQIKHRSNLAFNGDLGDLKYLSLTG